MYSTSVKREKKNPASQVEPGRGFSVSLGRHDVLPSDGAQTYHGDYQVQNEVIDRIESLPEQVIPSVHDDGAKHEHVCPAPR